MWGQQFLLDPAAKPYSTEPSSAEWHAVGDANRIR